MLIGFAIVFATANACFTSSSRKDPNPPYQSTTNTLPAETSSGR
jgi:hypothetical protein